MIRPGMHEVHELVLYDNIDPATLLDISLDQTETIHRRTLAMTGLIRAILNIPVLDRNEIYINILNIASALMANIRREHYNKESQKLPSLDGIANYVKEMPTIVTDTLRPEHVIAMRTNHPKDVAEELMERSESPLLVIGLDPVVSTDIYLHLPEQQGAHYCQQVRLRNHQLGEVEPMLSDLQKEALKEAATGRSIVLIDESRNTGNTQQIAGDYFCGLTGRFVLSVSIIDIRNREEFDPLYLDHNPIRNKQIITGKHRRRWIK